MYKIIGADQKEYGPITADQLRQWISEGRINAHTRVQAEGSAGWKSVSDLPEFAAVLPVAAPPPPMTPSLVAMAPVVTKSNQTAVWAMVTGIISLIPCCWGLGIISVVSIVLGCIALTQIKKNPQQTGSGFAIAGIVMGILSLILAVVCWLVVLSNPDFLKTFQNSFPH
jgi:hypothetical protein